MNKPHILFIDDGVDLLDFTFDLGFDLTVDENLNIVKRRAISTDSMSHGTVCAAIVQKYFPNFICSSLQVLNADNKKCDIDKLCKALEWSIMQDFDIINMSLGTTDPRDFTKLKPLINELSRKTTIVAALSNKTLITYPAAFSNVIGVMRSEADNDIDFCEMSIYGINFRAKARHSLSTNEGYSFTTESVNSFATPYITSVIASRNLYKKHINTIIASLANRRTSRRSIFPDHIESASIITAGVPRLDSLIYNISNYHEITCVSDAFNAKSSIDSNESLICLHGGNIKKEVIDALYNLYSKHTGEIVIAEDNTPNIDHVCHNLAHNFSYYFSGSKLTYISNFCSEIHIPVVLIRSECLEDIIGLCNAIRIVFSSQDYFPCISLNTALSFTFGFYYIQKNPHENINLFNELIRASNADILVLGEVNSGSLDTPYWHEMMSSVDILVDFSSTTGFKLARLFESDMHNKLIPVKETPLIGDAQHNTIAQSVYDILRNEHE